jgi:hypothetical protein
LEFDLIIYEIVSFDAQNSQRLSSGSVDSIQTTDLSDPMYDQESYTIILNIWIFDVQDKWEKDRSE